tara:strand:+ start:5927 stop:6778 length:852 start_codon:yes stop_codon:yes gene_type:complete
MEKSQKNILSCPFCQKKFYIDAKLLLPKGRVVKCSNCKNSWHQDPLKKSAPQKGAEAVFDAGKLAGDELPEDNMSGQRKIIRQLTKENVDVDTSPLSKLGAPNEQANYAYTAPLEKPVKLKKKLIKIISGLSILFTLLFVFRDSVTYYIPALSDLYKAMGIEVSISPAEKFEIREKSWSNLVQNGVPTVIIKGELANMSDRVYEAPTIKITLRGKGACKPSNLMDKVFKNKKVGDEFGSCVIDEWYVRPTNDRLLPGQIIPFSTLYPYDERFRITGVYLNFVR